MTDTSSSTPAPAIAPARGSSSSVTTDPNPSPPTAATTARTGNIASTAMWARLWGQPGPVPQPRNSSTVRKEASSLPPTAARGNEASMETNAEVPQLLESGAPSPTLRKRQRKRGRATPLGRERLKDRRRRRTRRVDEVKTSVEAEMPPLSQRAGPSRKAAVASPKPSVDVPQGMTGDVTEKWSEMELSNYQSDVAWEMGVTREGDVLFWGKGKGAAITFRGWPREGLRYYGRPPMGEVEARHWMVIEEIKSLRAAVERRAVVDEGERRRREVLDAIAAADAEVAWRMEREEEAEAEAEYDAPDCPCCAGAAHHPFSLDPQGEGEWEIRKRELGLKGFRVKPVANTMVAMGGEPDIREQEAEVRRLKDLAAIVRRDEEFARQLAAEEEEEYGYEEEEDGYEYEEMFSYPSVVGTGAPPAAPQRQHRLPDLWCTPGGPPRMPAGQQRTPEAIREQSRHPAPSADEGHRPEKRKKT